MADFIISAKIVTSLEKMETRNSGGSSCHTIDVGPSEYLAKLSAVILASLG
jgi:hypothetical protein